MLGVDTLRGDGSVGWRRATRWRSWPVVLLVVLAVATGAVVVVARWSPIGAPETRAVLTETGAATAIITSAPAGQAGMSQPAAIQRATRLVARAGAATAVRAREATLSLTTSDDEARLLPRHTWLVTFEGVTFTVNLGCTCYQETRPSTTLVLDAGDGTPLLAYGS